MRQFTSYFLAVPLPATHFESYQKLLSSIKQKVPSLTLSKEDTLHITLFYLTRESEEAFDHIEKVVRDNLPILSGIDLTTSGINYFSAEDPKVVFLDVTYPNAVKEFSDILKEELADYAAKDNELPFHPHLTLAVAKDPKSREDVLENQSDLIKFGEEVNWQFRITELGVYGADSKETPEYQEKILSIRM